ncbi:hypothetical protein VKT23_014847 [Stygiomarasmius scandens]|uniref:Uncharacterized protein n=1 Tax=Marasmiellus scandens TaxID=2682957 RepID=A0ABR1IZ88_9AGAR
MKVLKTLEDKDIEDNKMLKDKDIEGNEMLEDKDTEDDEMLEDEDTKDDKMLEDKDIEDNKMLEDKDIEDDKMLEEKALGCSAIFFARCQNPCKDTNFLDPPSTRVLGEVTTLGSTPKSTHGKTCQHLHLPET